MIGASLANPEDVEAIKQVITRWSRTWGEGNPDLFGGDYAPDALWINAFGVVKHVPVEMREFIAEGIADGFFNATISTANEPSIRFLRPDVAVVHVYTRVRGQTTRSGTEYPERRTHELVVLT